MMRVAVRFGALPATNLDKTGATLNDGSSKKYLDGGDEIEL
jgi:hypothetical protein